MNIQPSTHKQFSVLEEVASTKCSTRFDTNFEYDRLRLFEKVPFCMTRPKPQKMSDGEGGIGGFCE